MTGPSIAGPAMRLRGLVRKESLQILRDPSSISIAFVLPAILLLLFGYGVSLDARNVPIALVIENPGSETGSFAASLVGSRYFAPAVVRDRRAAEQALLAGEVDAIVVLKGDFARRLWSPAGAPIQVLVNGTDANTARIISGYLEGAWQKWLAQYAMDQGRALAPPVTIEQRVWFNAEVRSRNFLVPGLIAIIMTLIGTLLTALVVAREWERGTMEALMVTPVRIGEILLGKLIPYFLLGMGGMALSTAMAIWVFGVPFRGSAAVLFLVSALFMLAALGLGLFISTLARSQFVAGQVAIIVAFLPAFILSGFIFDIASMPRAVQLLTHLIPARYFVSSLQTLFLAGTVWPIVLANAAALAVMAAVFLALTWRKTRKSLE
ncbi:ABC-2 type transport system permease protein [Tistlia consotensis]|uniref:ABC-2 type transport system permease protein n=1 Tax=Tistlia consotensis USBA 355 TaxID=560819 RepID=A0A1Y6B7B1_9PROT|nr:ABC transporter permease [Tistlia consotensis]SME96756.1 ABC-2 type transport system permease protein [Tistlia consotensis USBA 355]SNR56113.1 ABC-2 type transport system permease protein [Tistlia consotensis]